MVNDQKPTGGAEAPLLVFDEEALAQVEKKQIKGA